jgi:hypothetical protein
MDIASQIAALQAAHGADVPIKVTISYRLDKYDGDAPRPGESKVPFEVIEGGDDMPTVVTHPAE